MNIDHFESSDYKFNIQEKETTIKENKQVEEIINKDPSINFINDLNDPQVVSEIKEELKNIDPQQLVQLITEQEKHTETMVKKISNKIDQTLSQTPHAPVEQKAHAIAKIIEENFKPLTDHFEHQAERAENAEVALGASSATIQMSLKLAETIGAHFGPAAELAAVSSIASTLGTGLLSTGLECYVIQKKSAYCRAQESQRDALIHQAAQSKNPKDIQHLEQQIHALNIEIKELKSALHEEIVSTSEKFLTEAFTGSAEMLEFVSNSHLLHLQTQMVEKLMLISDGASFAGSLVTFGYNSYQVVNSASHLKRVNAQLAELKEQLKTLTPEKAVLDYVIRAKIDRLSEAQREYVVQLSTKIANLTASSLALAAGAKVILVAAGVALGVTGGMVLTGMSLAGAGIAAGTAALGVSILAYRHRYDINYAAKVLPVASQKLLLGSELKSLKKVNKAVSNNLTRIEKEQQKVQVKLQKIMGNVGNYQSNDSAVVLSVLRKQEIESQSTFAKMSSLMQEMNDNLAAEKASRAKINDVQKQLEALDQRKQELGSNRTISNYQKKFKRYDTKTLDVVRKVVGEAMADDTSKQLIRQFLLDHDFPAKQGFGTDDVVAYIVKK